MERNLARSIDRADCLVDVSVVARQAGIAGNAERSLLRIELVAAALVRRTGDPDASLYLVADASLLGGRRRFADPAEARRLQDWVNRGLVEQVPDADERVLELAEMTGLPVITNDYYVDHRDSRPWIQGNDWQFLKPVPARGGTVELKPLHMGVRSPHEISRKAEESVLKKQGLLGAGRVPLENVVGRSWRCPARGCALYDTARGNSVLLPRMRAGRPTCELHALTLLDQGSRAAAAQLKLLLEGCCVARFTLDAGSTTRVGRSPGDGGLSLHGLIPDQLLARISRSHIEIEARETGLWVKDLSSYGSRVRRPRCGGSQGSWSPLPSDRSTDFGPGDELQLMPAVVLTRSGRRFPAELSRAWQDPKPEGPQPDPGTATSYFP
ncbi:FHA domain-containing protein [Streptomyces sp. SID13588]|uniref:FHA domain-containing protein n=1 Tax=Streptomyces sp. SID13588 TaxID=2706051 RepID=UPI0013CD44B2|nr:FHA domain-containing protein [Streptomyces sp. SID13588]NEA73810.1 FHA domain-containing protein [Streptomyces sp. SID13588]